LLAAAAFLFSAYSMLNENDGQQSGEEEVPVSHRRLQQQQQLSADSPPRYMRALFDDLHARHKLFDETPPEEIKYWFEYSGPLQVSFCRCVSSRVCHFEKLCVERTIPVLSHSSTEKTNLKSNGSHPCFGRTSIPSIITSGSIPNFELIVFIMDALI
jgi:hypothetical protein